MFLHKLLEITFWSSLNGKEKLCTPMVLTCRPILFRARKEIMKDVIRFSAYDSK